MEYNSDLTKVIIQNSRRDICLFFLFYYLSIIEGVFISETKKKITIKNFSAFYFNVQCIPHHGTSFYGSVHVVKEKVYLVEYITYRTPSFIIAVIR